jgi:hypothetical protein
MQTIKIFMGLYFRDLQSMQGIEAIEAHGNTSSTHADKPFYAFLDSLVCIA